MFFTNIDEAGRKNMHTTYIKLKWPGLYVKITSNNLFLLNVTFLSKMFKKHRQRPYIIRLLKVLHLFILISKII